MAIKVLGGASLVEADVRTTVKALRTILYDPAGNPIVDDWPGKPKVGGFFSGIGNVSTFPAAMAADVYFLSMRMLPTTKRVCKIYSLEMQVVMTTTDANITVAGSLEARRFTGGYPTGGSLRYSPNGPPTLLVGKMDEWLPLAFFGL